MCFSAAASFSAGTLLLAVGAVTLRMVQRSAQRPYAAIPLLFAVQQLVEGVVWLSFGGPAGLNFVATQVYSFFSHVLWPVYVPLAAWRMEPRGPRRRALSAFVAAGLVVGGTCCSASSRPPSARLPWAATWSTSRRTSTPPLR